MTHTHFIGIGGTGLSAMARVLLERGEKVSGSDRQLSPLAADLQAAGATVYIGHAAEQISGADVVVRSSAVPEDNVEVLAAQQAGIPVLRRIDYLAQLIDERPTIGIAGSHGKTTTTALVASLLRAADRDPTVVNGGIMNAYGSNAWLGRTTVIRQ